MAKQKITVDGLTISMSKNGYISLTDLARKNSKRKPKDLIQSWLRNRGTLQFLDTWERVNNESFNGSQMAAFKSSLLSKKII